MAYKTQTSKITYFRTGYKIVMWDVLSFDWDSNVTQEKCLRKCY